MLKIEDRQSESEMYLYFYSQKEVKPKKKCKHSLIESADKK